MQVKFSALMNQFLSWAAKCRHPVTCDVYRFYFTRFLTEVGDIDIKKIRPCDVTGWAKTWHESQAIVRLFRWAVEEANILKTNPLSYVKHPPKGARRRTLTKRESIQLLKAASLDFRMLLFAYGETWARPGELRAAKFCDIYPKTTPQKLRAALLQGRAMIVLFDYKNRKSRRLPNEPRVILLSPVVGKLIVRLMTSGREDQEKIFTTAQGRNWTPNAVRCRMRRLRSKLGWKADARGENIVPYTFRHTGATEASAAGIRDRLLADILGHTETSTTQRYQHLSTDHLRSALKKLWAKRAKPR